MPVLDPGDSNAVRAASADEHSQYTRATLADYCWVRSYLVSAHGHGIRATDAIHAALADKPWLPVLVTA